MGFSLGSLFGTGGSKSSSSSFIPEQKDALIDTLKLYMPTLGQNTVYQGNRIAGMTPVQQGVLDSASNFLSLFSTPQQVGTPLSGETGNAIKGLLGGELGAEYISPEQTEKYFKASIYDPTMYALKNDTLPTIDEGYAGGNFFGSGRSNAREKAVSDTARSLSEQRADLNWNVLGKNMETAESKAHRSLSTLGSAMQYGQQPAQATLNNLQIAAAQLGGLGEMFGIGQEGQTQEQKEIESAVAKFAEENQITDPTNLAIILSLIGQTMSTSQTQTKNPGLGAQFLGSVFGGGKGLGQAASSGIQGLFS